ncbi:MAG: hypothetical protein ACD_46C00424G0005 [uncultured bacterium]|nr:MAG: hypothetical protein ACD_46C00424G0005 [uncultured bacterium]
MKSIISLIGVFLIILGIVGFSYKYFSYTTDEKVAEIGNVKVTAEKEKTIVISPLLSGASLAAGVVLLIVGMSRKF